MEFFITVTLFVCCLTAFQVEGFEDYERGLSHKSHARLKELKEYEIVEPKQLTFGQKHRYKRDLTTQINELTEEHSPNVKFQFNFNGVSYVIDLSNNKLLLPANYSYSVASKSGVTIYNATEKDYNHCNYVGTLENITDSHARINTCSGLRGYIGTPDDFLFIEPLEDNKHVVYRRQVPDDSHSFCGVHDLKRDVTERNSTTSLELESVEKLVGSDFKTRHPKTPITIEPLYVELTAVADQDKARLGNHAAMKRILEIVNYMDGYYYNLNIRIVLVHMQIWPTNQINVSSDYMRNLEGFSQYAARTFPNADAVALFSGKTFADSIYGVASVIGELCTKTGAAIIQDTFSTIFTTTTAAHELGHLLGMEHDTQNCQCEGNTCIMYPVPSSTIIQNWSSCSRHYLGNSHDKGRLFCLKNVPDPSTIIGRNTCGNLFVEEGEECDCGSPLLCTSTCCDPYSCKLKGKAVCDDGRCCRNCQFVRQGVQCRAATQECDFAEFCLGNSGQCPGDFHAQDGTPCGSNNFLCHGGVCMTNDKQCQSFRGPDSSTCPDEAYSLNQMGNSLLNCGKNGSGNFISCDVSDARCGKLLCQGGKPGPISKFFTIVHNKIKCMFIQSPDTKEILGAHDMLGYVSDFTKCGSNKICREKKCVVWEPSTCSKKCNGKGTCNNMGNCNCVAGWAPPVCLDKGWGGSIDGGGIVTDGDVEETEDQDEDPPQDRNEAFDDDDTSIAFRHGANAHIYCMMIIKALVFILFY